MTVRILIVGTVPPPKAPYSTDLGAIAVHHVAIGDEVEVLSPDARSAAHRHASLRGMRLGLQLFWYSRHFDELVLRIEPGVPLVARATRFERALALITLGASLRMWQSVTLRLDSPVPLPGGLGGRATRQLWRRADRIVVANEEDRTELLKVPGIDTERIEVTRAPHDGFTNPAQLPWSALGEEPGREQVLGLVVERAGERRALSSARVDLGRAPTGPTTVSIFDHVPPDSPDVAGLVRLLSDRARFLLARARGR